MQATLYCDISTGTVSSKPGGASFDWPPLVAGDDLTLKLRLTQTIDDNASEIDRTITGLKASLGLPDARPTGGTFKLKIGPDAASAGVNLTGPIAYNAAPEALETAINALSGLGALGTASVSLSGGSWLVKFSGTDAGVAIVAGENTLAPLSFVRHLSYDFDGEPLHEIRLVQAPVAFTSSSARVVPAAPYIIRSQAGGSSGESKWNEIQKLVVPPEFRGTYQIRRSYGKSTLLSPADGSSEIADAIALLVDTAGEFKVTNPSDYSVNIEFAGSMAGVGFDLLTVEVIDAPLGDIVATVGTNTAEMLAFLRSGGTKLQLELELRFEDPNDDEVIYTLTIIRDEIEVRADVNFAELGSSPLVDWTRPPLPADYIPITGDTIVTGAQAIEPIALGTGAATSFVVDHNLDSPVVEVIVQENVADGLILVLGTDYNVEINSSNSLTIISLTGAPAADAWLASVQTIGARGRYETHTHPITEIVGLRAELDAMGANVDLLLARLGLSGLSSSSSAGTSAPGIKWKLPKFAEIFGVRGSTSEIGKDLSSVDSAALSSKGGGFFAAVHAVPGTETALPIPLVPGTPGTLYQNQSGNTVILPGGYGHRSRPVLDDGFAAYDGRQWYALERYAADEVFNGYVFTADYSNDKIDVTGWTPALGTRVRVASTGALPSPLLADTDYYIDLAGAWIQLTATLGGSAINLTNAGGGVHTISLAPGSSFYPTDFNRELFFLAVNEAELRPGFMFETFFGLELGLFKPESRAQYMLVIEHGVFSDDLDPNTTGPNLAAITWNPTPILSQRIMLTVTPVTRTFGCRVKRSTGGTLTSQKIVFGAEAAGGSVPASANFALRARLIRFDTEDSISTPRGYVGIVGLDKTDDETAGSSSLGIATIKVIA